MNMANQSVQKTIWLITGASAGLGLEMALSALRRGHRVIGTTRNAQTAALNSPEFSQLGGQWLQTDVSSASAQATIEKAVQQEEVLLGEQGPPHWVVVNNAAYAMLGSVEEASEEQITQYFNSNVFSMMRVWKATIPALRRNRSGTLITISSMLGVTARPEQMLYCASKATMESLTRSYGSLLSQFGIRTLILQPGAFRTKFAANIAPSDLKAVEDYKKTFEDWNKMVKAVADDPTLVTGDPERFGKLVVDAVEGKGLFEGFWAEQLKAEAVTLPIGSDSHRQISDVLTAMTAEVANAAAIAESTDFVGA